MDRMFVFVGLERIGGWMCWDISDPTAPVFQVKAIFYGSGAFLLRNAFVFFFDPFGCSCSCVCGCVSLYVCDLIFFVLVCVWLVRAGGDYLPLFSR